MHSPQDIHEQHPLHNEPPTVQVRTGLPRPWSDGLDHLAIELGVSKARLLQEGALLVLRYHDRGAGLPEPIAPLTQNTEKEAEKMNFNSKSPRAANCSPAMGNVCERQGGTHSTPTLTELVNQVLTWCSNRSIVITGSEGRDFLLVQFDSEYRVVDVQENPCGEDGGLFSVCWSLHDTTGGSLESLACGIEDNILPGPLYVAASEAKP